MDWKKCPLTEKYYNLIRNLVGRFLEKKNISPNQISLLGLILAILVPLGFYSHALWGVILILLSGVADSIDGMIARDKNKESIKGKFLDSSLDRFSDLFYLLGFYVLSIQQGWDKEAGIVLFLALGFSFAISYLKAKAESLGKKCISGFMDRVSRTLFLAGWGLIWVLFGGREAVFFVGLVLYTLLTLFTVIQRLVEVLKQM